MNADKNIEQRLSIETLERAAHILKAVAHPARLSILQVLAHHEELDVTGLCRSIGTDCELSMMSHHLSKMRAHGVLTSRKEGKQVFYRITDRSILHIFDCIDRCANDNNQS